MTEKKKLKIQFKFIFFSSTYFIPFRVGMVDHCTRANTNEGAKEKDRMKEKKDHAPDVPWHALQIPFHEVFQPK